MKKLFLTSSAHIVAGHIGKQLDLSTENKLLFIDTASEPIDDEKEWLKNDRSALVNARFDVTDYTITDQTESEVSSTLEEFDYIYFSGGDTPYLLEQSNKIGFKKIIRDMILDKGKVYFGTSAGSIITGPVVPEYLYTDGVPEYKERLGFELVNFTIVPHWGSDDFRDRYLKRRLEIAYRDDQFPLITLTDNQYIEVNDDCIKIIDVTKQT